MVLLFGAVSLAWADDDEEHGFGSKIFSIFSSRDDVENVRTDLYKESCGECHFAYQPGLLPTASWKKLMTATQLQDHFGENAELDEVDRAKLEAFLVKHAADKSEYRISIKIARSVNDGNPPLKITETRYIRRKHHELTDREIKNNKDVRLLGNCNACHRKAEEGVFEEDTVSIPNVPDWED